MSIVTDAKNLVGKVKYKFGADNVAGGLADCSSFTQYVYKKNGVDIGRNTEAQWSKGAPVSKDKLKEGDLVFFHSTYPSGYKDNVSHVGIYIGNGNFVHNSSGSGTTINNLNESYYQRHYLGAKRMTSPAGSHLNPTFTGEEITSGFSDDTDLDLFGQVIKFVVILALILMALVFFFGAFGASPTAAAKKIVTKKVKKGGSENE